MERNLQAELHRRTEVAPPHAVCSFGTPSVPYAGPAAPRRGECRPGTGWSVPPGAEWEEGTMSPMDSRGVQERRAATAELDLSVIIPAYNEERRLPRTMETIIRYLDRQPWKYEIAVVDDGSGDSTR